MTVLAKRRSNRPLTEFACRCLDDFVLNKVSDSYHSNQKNTGVHVIVDGSMSEFIVFLYEEEVFRLVMMDHKPISIKLSFTSFYDSYGQPSSTTAERLNGLLDSSFALGLIPQGVRIFRDQEYYTTYIGRGDEKIAIGSNLVGSVYIKPDKEKLIFSGLTSTVSISNGEIYE